MSVPVAARTGRLPSASAELLQQAWLLPPDATGTLALILAERQSSGSYNAAFFYFRDGLDIARVHEVYLFGAAEPDTWIDITDTIELKLHAALAHASQIRGDLQEREERQRARAREIGEPHGFEYAEAFKRLLLN